ncbi:MAG: hypothetical protein OES26_07575 [Gammaproteobacteria bacterium]|nr:hypothetical protein [Gammaproteobacteria bacterium]
MFSQYRRQQESQADKKDGGLAAVAQSRRMGGRQCHRTLDIGIASGGQRFGAP